MRRDYAGAARRARLAAPLGGTALDLGIVGDDLTGWPDGTAGPFWVCIGRGTGTEEKILCSSRVGNSLTVFTDGLLNGRGGDGTAIVEHAYNDYLEHVFSATDADEANEHVNAATDVHGIAGAVVGTSDAQTLTNKTLDFNANTITNIPQSAVIGLVGDITALEAADVSLQGQITTLDAEKADLASPTFTGTVVLPSTTSIGTVSATEIGYVDGATSNIQAQLDAKAPIDSPTFTGTPSFPAGTIFDGQDLTTYISENGLPPGGTDGQVLTKQSAADGDALWETPTGGTGGGVPAGGLTGEVLTKLSDTDGDADWVAPTGAEPYVLYHMLYA